MVDADDDVGVAGAGDGGEVTEGLADVALVLFFGGAIFTFERLAEAESASFAAVREFAVGHLHKARIQPIYGNKRESSRTKENKNKKPVHQQTCARHNLHRVKK